MPNSWTMWKVWVISRPLFLRKDECERKPPNSSSTTGFTNNDIDKITKSLDADKEHGHDMISKRML